VPVFDLSSSLWARIWEAQVDATSFKSLPTERPASTWKLSDDRIVQYIRKPLLLVSPARTSSTASLQHMRKTSFPYSSVLCPTHPYRLSPMFPRPAKPALLRARLVIMFLVSYWFARLLCENQWVLAVHSVLGTSQWELTCCFPFPSRFLHNPKYRQADSICTSGSSPQIVIYWNLIQFIIIFVNPIPSARNFKHTYIL
jgi:hypothetical protein